MESRSRGWKETLGVEVDESSDVDEGGKRFGKGDATCCPDQVWCVEDDGR